MEIKQMMILISQTGRAIKMILNVWFYFCFFLISESTAYGENGISFPKFPDDPTFEDCEILRKQYQFIRANLNNQLSGCMHQKPTFGFGNTCSGRQTLMAWSQCNDIEVTVCKVEVARDKAISECRESAKPNSKINNATVISNVNNLYEDTSDYYAKARNILDILQNPKVFLRDNLSQYPNVIQKLFGTHEDDFDVDLGQEIYRYSQNMVEVSVDQAPNDIVRMIQKSALQHISSVHKNMMLDLKNAIDNMNGFIIDKSATHLDSAIEQKHKPNEELCHVLGTC
jgi:hypothetical protein